MKAFLLAAFIFLSASAFASRSVNTKLCAKYFLTSGNMVVDAIVQSHVGLASAIHLQHGEGYIVLNKKGGINFNQNKLDGRYVEDVLLDNIAVELPKEVSSSDMVQRGILFKYKKNMYVTLGQFYDGTILAVEQQTHKMLRIDLDQVMEIIGRIVNQKAFTVGESVRISNSEVRMRNTWNAKIREISGIYALVRYDYVLTKGANSVPFSEVRTTEKLIPITLLERAN